MIILQFLLLLGLSFSSSQTESFEILALSDIHLDTKYQPKSGPESACRDPRNILKQVAPYGRLECDSPEILFKNVLNHAEKQFQGVSPKIVIITGDFVAHDLAEYYGLQQAMHIISRIKDLISQKFPNSIILPTLGNNDFTYDYQVPNGPDFISQYYEFYYNTWFGSSAPEMNKKILFTKRAKAQIRRTGLYTAEIAPHLHILSFNSILYSFKNDPTNDPEGADLQMKWIEEILAQAPEGEMFIPMYHIPPGRDNFGGQEWVDSYQETFLSLLQKYKTKIKTNFAGHFHLQNLHSIVNCSTWDPYGSVLLSPSVSPIFRNNPGFRIYKFSQASETKLDSYVDHFLLLNNYNQDLWSGKVRSINTYWTLNYSVNLAYGYEYSGFSVFLYWLDTLTSDSNLVMNMLATMGYDNGREEEITQYFKDTFKWHLPTSLQKNWPILCREVCPGKSNYEHCLTHQTSLKFKD